MKKLLAVLLALSAIGMIMAGCSKSEEGSGTPAPEATKTEEGG